MAIEHGKHLVMVNVETDALVGPLLAERASAAGVIYSLAYGDQPALIAEQVDWARAIGLEVVAAGKGTPSTSRSTTVARPTQSGSTMGSRQRQLPRVV